MNIELDKSTHTYTVNGEIAAISVTELLKKHGLSPNYNFPVDKNAVKESIEYGNDLHKECENILNDNDYTPILAHACLFKEWCKNNLDCGVGEQMIAYDSDGFIIAGTADVIGMLRNGEKIIADHKTSSKFYEEYVSWQVSILDYMFKKNSGSIINGKIINWNGANKFICFQYNRADGSMKEIELNRIPDEEIERLIECEKHGEIYQRKVLSVESELAKRFEEAEKFLIQKEIEYRQAEKTAKDIREQLKNKMEEQRINRYETDKIKITYIPPMDRISVDSKKLKEKYPSVFSECQKLQKVKSSVRVTIKNDGEVFDND